MTHFDIIAREVRGRRGVCSRATCLTVERGRADQEFEDLRHHDGRYEGGWLIGVSETEKWKWLNISTVVSVEIHRESDLDPDQAA